ncbi:MAG: dTDP-4-dehydrorhamnose 3,5-epimerase [Bdellovibrionales bacterium CG10_big_fil_rev_8_21_14_0_10_45_34]|nr:MAG: dTDP-4-dehydrorhamnose 3,5-epimerase [Bdellovibrionales bacterium CG10_big_fil_rev_8_21_14_0_10_45_34]
MTKEGLGPFDGLVEFPGRKFEDSRGWFSELFRGSFAETQIETGQFVQDNLSYSKKGVVRGMHLQTPPHEQGKFVRCMAGAIWDVVVDLRPNSPTYKQWKAFEVSFESLNAIYVPKGFAHGFQVLSEFALVLYKCTSEYAPQHDKGIKYDCPELAITWPAPILEVSEKDRNLPGLSDFLKEYL